MKVVVLVEGESDARALEALLQPIIALAGSRGIGVKFSSFGGKEQLLTDGLKFAAARLREHPQDYCIALPDLHPCGQARPPWQHATAAELRQRLQEGFIRAMDAAGASPELVGHFLAHVLQHDLEALLLASEERLRLRLGRKRFRRCWRLPVEEQDDTEPPKVVVQRLFRKAGRRYQETRDAPWILSKVDLEALCQACPQSFAPFISDLRRLVDRP